MSPEIIFVVEEAPEGGYKARALGPSIFTQGETLDEAREAVKDPVRCYCEDYDMSRSICLTMQIVGKKKDESWNPGIR